MILRAFLSLSILGVICKCRPILRRLWQLWYNEKRSAATTPTTPGRHPKPASLHSHQQRSTHHGHPPPQRTYRPAATNRRPNQKFSEQNAHYLLTIRSSQAKKWLQATNRHPNQKFSEQNAHYLLTTFLDAGPSALL